ncbi:MAG: FHA domain-containing protein [Bdellovibrionales bacterium]|nr:FHA domain-containing protein [Bdellovibrionales bacterium]
MQKKNAPNRRDKKESTAGSNRLVGWLVSYAQDDLGKAYEIRAGRTLISSHRDAEERVIMVDEQTVSSPHSAMKASPSHELVLQDIFSDGGTFVRKSSDEKENRITGPVSLQHGDWLRFGEADPLQVCLIDGPKR